ncbi:MAG: CDP-alcohol phosphatidyltransferase [Parcubacteria group bacterium Gr01-1014_29]|nr:MAG: CDP-alcohol phosphatidyltransferase [Parcubacteria group bacterium Gr01-1014_29]
MESIKELREITQREKIEGRERPWGYRVFQRGPSIYITWLLLHTPLTPNAITLLSILSGVGGAYLLLCPDWKVKLAALFLFYLNLLLDRVDGEMARYKKQFSLKGIYLDELNHYVIPPLFFLSLAWGLKDATAHHESLILLAGIWAGFAAILLRLTHNLPYGIFLKKYVKHNDIFALPASSPSISDLRTHYSFFYMLLRFAHQFQDFFIVVVLFILALGMEQYIAPNAFLFPYTSLLLFGYAIYLPLLVIENIIKGILTIESRMSELSNTIQK